MCTDLSRRANANNLATALATIGSQVDDPVGGANEIEVVLNDQEGVPRPRATYETP